MTRRIDPNVLKSVPRLFTGAAHANTIQIAEDAYGCETGIPTVLPAPPRMPLLSYVDFRGEPNTTPTYAPPKHARLRLVGGCGSSPPSFPPPAPLPRAA